MKVNILGSCCTRELFNYSKDYEVNCYVLQQSLFTMFTTPFDITEEDARSVDNTNFTNRVMYYEFRKLGLPKIIEADGDILLIDFADCRYDIYELNKPKGTKIIYTHNARATLDHLLTKPEYSDIERKYVNVVESFTDEELEDMVKKLCSRLLEKYKPQNIILNRIDMAKSYFENGEEFQFVDNFHLSREPFIHKIEEIFLKIMPDCKVLECEYSPLVDINHRFGGPHPLHYEDIYYEYRMNILDDLIKNGNNAKEINKTYSEIYQKNIDKIKLKKHLSSADCRSSKRVD